MGLEWGIVEMEKGWGQNRRIFHQKEGPRRAMIER